jgi:osmotically-inducible protein OsmY
MSDSQPDNATTVDLSDLIAALEAAGIFVDVASRDGALVVSGEVDSAEMRQAALDLTGIVARRSGLGLQDAIEVLDVEFEIGSGDFQDIEPALRQSRDTDMVYDVGTIDSELASDEAIPYFPPTDPVFGENRADPDNIVVIGGFQPTSMTGDNNGVRIRLDDDERISDDVRRELREDASTTDLDLVVETRNAIVRLRGEVAAVEDSDNAEAVASRVAGVEEVRNELTIVGPIGDRHGSERVSSSE